MRGKKGLLVLIAVGVPLSSIALFGGTAVAGKGTGQGLTNCTFGGTINFNPPLTPNGSTTIKKEVTTVSAQLTGCSGGTPPGPSGSAVAVKPIKIKTPKGQAGGTCSSFDSNASSVNVKVKIKWPGEKPSKFTVAGLNPTVNTQGEVGFSGSFTVSGSYAGTGSLGVYLTPQSSNDIATCGNNTSVSSLQIDSSTSSGSI